jgi:hypothetical protein
MLAGELLFETWIPGVLLWALLYISDYASTIASARLYRSGVLTSEANGTVSSELFVTVGPAPAGVQLIQFV